MRPSSRPDFSPQDPNSSNTQNLIGPSAHWTALRRAGQSEVLASKARSYILQMLSQDASGASRHVNS